MGWCADENGPAKAFSQLEIASHRACINHKAYIIVVCWLKPIVLGRMINFCGIDNAEIVDREQQFYRRRLKEAIHTKVHLTRGQVKFLTMSL